MLVRLRSRGCMQGSPQQAVPERRRWRRVEPLARAYLGNSLHLLGAPPRLAVLQLAPAMHGRAVIPSCPCCHPLLPLPSPPPAPGRPADGGRHAGAHAAAPAALRGAAGLLRAPAAQVPAPRTLRLPRRQPGGARARIPVCAPGRAGAARAGPGRRAQGTPPGPAAGRGLLAAAQSHACVRGS